MDPASILGILLGFGIILTANMLEGGHPGAIFLFPPMLLVFGTTIMIAIAGGTLADAKYAFTTMVKALRAKPESPAAPLDTIVALTGKARKDGLLALEDELKEIDDPFLERGVKLAVDGTDPEDLRDILEAEVTAHRAANKPASKFFADMGAYAPTIGIVGTVMGLVMVLENLAEPETLGHSIAAAFLATLWGVFSANVLWFPLSNRIKRVNDLEAERMELIVEGVLAIQSGENPRMVNQKLSAMLTPDVRAAAEKAKAAAEGKDAA